MSSAFSVFSVAMACVASAAGFSAGVATVAVACSTAGSMITGPGLFELELLDAVADFESDFPQPTEIINRPTTNSENARDIMGLPK